MGHLSKKTTFQINQLMKPYQAFKGLLLYWNFGCWEPIKVLFSINN